KSSRSLFSASGMMPRTYATALLTTAPTAAGTTAATAARPSARSDGHRSGDGNGRRSSQPLQKLLHHRPRKDEQRVLPVCHEGEEIGVAEPALDRLPAGGVFAGLALALEADKALRRVQPHVVAVAPSSGARERDSASFAAKLAEHVHDLPLYPCALVSARLPHIPVLSIPSRKSRRPQPPGSSGQGGVMPALPTWRRAGRRNSLAA